jgi:hypothetical protein
MAEVRLPLELHQGILENLRDDISSLSRCALVCSTWRSMVQPWMFATLTVGAQPPPFPRLEEIRAFFAMSPYLEQHVSKLELLGGRAGARLYVKSIFPFGQRDHAQELRIQRVIQHQIRMFRGEDIFHLRLFPHVQSIHFQEGSISSLSHLLYHYPHLHTLSLCRVSFGADLPVAHCAVQNLNILFTRRNDNSEWPTLFQAPYLKHLKLVWEYHTPHIISPPDVRLLRVVLESVPSTLDSICWIICHTGSAYGSFPDPILGEPPSSTLDIYDGL